MVRTACGCRCCWPITSAIATIAVWASCIDRMRQKRLTMFDSPFRRVVYSRAHSRSTSLRGHHENGGMAEWFKAAVLKTAVALVVTGGSNPSPSALKADRSGRCRSGRTEPPAKRLWGLNSTQGSNPCLPAINNVKCVSYPCSSADRARPCGG